MEGASLYRCGPLVGGVSPATRGRCEAHALDHKDGGDAPAERSSLPGTAELCDPNHPRQGCPPAQSAPGRRQDYVTQFLQARAQRHHGFAPVCGFLDGINSPESRAAPTGSGPEAATLPEVGAAVPDSCRLQTSRIQHSSPETESVFSCALSQLIPSLVSPRCRLSFGASAAMLLQLQWAAVTADSCLATAANIIPNETVRTIPTPRADISGGLRGGAA